MTPSGQSLFHRDNTVLPPRANGFSLIEIIAVIGIIGILLAITVPGLIVLTPSRKSAIHEVSGFLENARARAVATKSEMIVAFADGSFPGERGPYRTFALFALDESPKDSSGERPPRLLTPWRTLPEGLVFAHREHFEVQNGAAFRTILDSPARRSFPLPDINSPGVEPGMAELPFLLFAPDGGVRIPAFTDADALHVGIVEGHFERQTGRIRLTSTRSGENGTGLFGNGECLEVGAYTGRTRILTD